MAKTERVKTGILQGLLVAVVCGVVLMLSTVAGNAAAGRPNQSQYDPCEQYEDGVARKEPTCASSTTAQETTTTVGRETTTTEQATTTVVEETTTTVEGETTTTVTVGHAEAARPQSGTLALTGSNSTALAGIGIALVAAGTLVVVTTSRRQRAHG